MYTKCKQWRINVISPDADRMLLLSYHWLKTWSWGNNGVNSHIFLVDKFSRELFKLERHNHACPRLKLKIVCTLPWDHILLDLYINTILYFRVVHSHRTPITKTSGDRTVSAACRKIKFDKFPQMALWHLQSCHLLIMCRVKFCEYT